MNNNKAFSSDDVKAIVLAAGKGVRMRSDLPKVLHPLAGKPLISHVIENLRGAGIADICAVVGYEGLMVERELGGSVSVVWQHQQLGTGHAVMQTESLLSHFFGKVIIACGDVPLFSSATFSRLIEMSGMNNTGAVVATMVLNDPHGYGRVIKDEYGDLLRIVEERDASEEERKIREVNTGTYIFDARYLFEGLKRIDRDNAQGEYYLPDALKYIREQGSAVKTYTLSDPVEGSGINSMEELQRLEEYLGARKD